MLTALLVLAAAITAGILGVIGGIGYVVVKVADAFINP